MKRSISKNGRPKAFLGAVIGLGTNLLGAAINSEAQERQAATQKRIQEHQDALTAASSFNEMLGLTRNVQKEYENRFRVNYKAGGKRKLRHGFKITDGGYAIPIDNNTFLLRGSSHEDINETGQTGIGIKIGNKEIEAEDGEVLMKKGGTVRIYSDTLKLPNGNTPAEDVLKGGDKELDFNIQEHMNGDKTFSNRRYLKCGGKVKRQKCWDGSEFTTSDYVGLGTNILGSLGAYLINSKAADAISMPRKPVMNSSAKLITNYNIAPRLSELANSKRIALKDSDETISSASRLEKRNMINSLYNQEANKLWGEKTNKEIALLNEDIKNQQDIASKNTELINAYYDKLLDAESRKSLGKQQALSIGLSGITQSIGNFLQSGIDNYQADQARRMQLAASQYGSAERAASMGVDFSPSTMRALRDDAQTKMDRFDVGSTDYNAALDSYNFWNSRLSKPITSTPRKKRSLASPSTINRPGIWYNPFTGQGQV